MFPRFLVAVFDIIQLLQLRGSRPKFIRTSSRPSWTTATVVFVLRWRSTLTRTHLELLYMCKPLKITQDNLSPRLWNPAVGWETRWRGSHRSVILLYSTYPDGRKLLFSAGRGTFQSGPEKVGCFGVFTWIAATMTVTWKKTNDRIRFLNAKMLEKCLSVL